MTPEELAAVGLRLDLDGPVATVTLDRPDVRNAQTPAMWLALGEIGRTLPDDVRVVVVTGEGETFSAGLDRAMLDPANAGRSEEHTSELQSQFHLVCRLLLEKKK